MQLILNGITGPGGFGVANDEGQNGRHSGADRP